MVDYVEEEPIVIDRVRGNLFAIKIGETEIEIPPQDYCPEERSPRSSSPLVQPDEL